MTGTQAWVALKLSLNSPLFVAAIWGCFVALFLKKTEHNHLFTSMWPAVHTVGVLF
jgi:hypothetical protein